MTSQPDPRPTPDRPCPRCAHRPHEPGACEARYRVTFEKGEMGDPCLCEYDPRPTPDRPSTTALEIAGFHHKQQRAITGLQSWQVCTAWPCRAVAEARASTALDVERLAPLIDQHAFVQRPLYSECACGEWTGAESWSEHAAARILAALHPEPDRGCAGDGMGEPSTCQIHMAPWYRAKGRCEKAENRGDSHSEE